MRTAFLPLVFCLLLFMVETGISLHLFSASYQDVGSPEPTRRENFLVPDPEYIKLISGSFKPLFTQLLYMKGVLELASVTPEKMEYLFTLFLVCLQLDPEMRNAAFFGGVVLPQKPNEIRRGITLLKDAMALNPNEWRFPYWAGFNCFQLEDYQGAVALYQQASRLPGSPTYLKTNLAQLFYQANGPELALKNLEGMTESIKDPDVLEFLRQRMDWLKNIIFLEEKVGAYLKAVGTLPVRLDELVEKGLLRELPQDSFGGGFYLERSASPGSKTYQVKSGH